MGIDTQKFDRERKEKQKEKLAKAKDKEFKPLLLIQYYIEAEENVKTYFRYPICGWWTLLPDRVQLEPPVQLVVHANHQVVLVVMNSKKSPRRRLMIRSEQPWPVYPDERAGARKSEENQEKIRSIVRN
jgi:hypothetical protein